MIIIINNLRSRSKRQNHASVVLLGQLFLLGGGWETKTTEVRTMMMVDGIDDLDLDLDDKQQRR